jgi:hypothetical protein
MTNKKKKTKLIIRTEDQRIALMDTIESLELPFQSDVGKVRMTRSIAQNSLYWAWMQDMANTTVNEYSGHTVDEWHKMMKKEFLLPIYERVFDDIKELMAKLRDAWRAGAKSEINYMVDKMCSKSEDGTEWISTTRAEVEHFSEYLNEIEHYCHQRGILLRTDPDIYFIATQNK